MKRISALFLFIVLLTGVFCGCTASHGGDINSSVKAENKVKPERFTLADFTDKTIINAEFHGNTLVLLTQSTPDDEETENENYKPIYNLILCDVEKMKLIVDNTLDINVLDYTMFLTNDNVIAYSYDENQTASFFDFTGKLIKHGNYKPIDIYEQKTKASSLITNDFIIYEDYSYLSTENYTAVIFNPTPETAYIYKSDTHTDILTGFNTSVAEWSGGEIYIKDLAAKKQLCSVKTNSETDSKQISIGVSAMNENYLFYSVVKQSANSETVLETPYLVRYFEDSSAKSINVTALNEDDFAQSDKDIIKSACVNYQINICFPKNTEEIPCYGYKIKNDLQTVCKNLALRQLCDYFALFPSGFFNELKTKYNTVIDLYPASEITSLSDSSAAVDGLTSNMSASRGDYNVSSVVLITNSMSCKSNLAHELTHVSEQAFFNEANQASWESSWETSWEKLNPDGFEYDNTYDLYFSNSEESTLDYTYQFDGDVNDAYFYDRYAKTFDIEDRARTFEKLFTACDEYDSGDWLKSPHLMKKAELICKMMRDSFNLVNSADSVYWENNLKNIKDRLQSTSD